MATYLNFLQLVMQSSSLGEDEKKVLFNLAPVIGEEDLQKLISIFNAEREALAAMPSIREGIEQGMKTMFIGAEKAFSKYKKQVIKKVERNGHDAGVSDIETQINNL